METCRIWCTFRHFCVRVESFVDKVQKGFSDFHTLLWCTRDQLVVVLVLITRHISHNLIHPLCFFIYRNHTLYIAATQINCCQMAIDVTERATLCLRHSEFSRLDSSSLWRSFFISAVAPLHWKVQAHFLDSCIACRLGKAPCPILSALQNAYWTYWSCRKEPQWICWVTPGGAAAMFPWSSSNPAGVPWPGGWANAYGRFSCRHDWDSPLQPSSEVSQKAPPSRNPNGKFAHTFTGSLPRMDYRYRLHIQPMVCYWSESIPFIVHFRLQRLVPGKRVLFHPLHLPFFSKSTEGNI